MKIIFLDINGVLNSREFDLRRRLSPDEGMAAMLDPVAVARLNRLLDATDAEIVLTSTWRRGGLLREAREAFRVLRVRKTIMAATPDLFGHDALDDCRRGSEIQSWLATYGVSVHSFVILDDGDDMGQLTPRLVQTDFSIGLTDVNVDNAIQLLNSPQPVL